MTAFDVNTTAEQVAQTLASSISGKNVIVNGTTWGGLGGEATRVIAKHANLVVVGGRDPAKIQETINKIKAETPSANLRPLILDLNSLAAARKAALEVNSYTESFHVLINSAAIMAVPYLKTEDGLEHHLAVNHFAPFLFTALIFNKLASSGTAEDPARIVNISSGGHRASDIRFNDLDFSDGKVYDKWQGYGQSKTANILFANEIARRAKEKNLPVVAYSLHPGVIVNTHLGEHLTDADLSLLRNEKGEWIYPTKSLQQGAATYIVAAFDPSILSSSGAYLDDANINEESRAPHARSQESAEKLWTLSESVVKEKFVI